MNIKVLIATHKKYRVPNDSIYIPIQVGSTGKEGIGYIRDNTGDNISLKNPYYCELTGLYWGIKNLECDYIGLVHYRRYFSNKINRKMFRSDKFDYILSKNDAEEILKSYDIVLPKKRKYYIETLYSHYAHTHYKEHLDETREILKSIYPEYINDFDKVMKQRSGHMFNMFIMRKELAVKYGEWLFTILDALENKIDISQYDAFQARLFGRVSELLLNVWIVHNKLEYKELEHIHMEKINWFNKGTAFIRAKFTKRKFQGSF